MRTPPLLADFSHARACKPFCENSLTLPLQVDAVYYLVGDYLELPGLAQAEFEQAIADAVLVWER